MLCLVRGLRLAMDGLGWIYFVRVSLYACVARAFSCYSGIRLRMAVVPQRHRPPPAVMLLLRQNAAHVSLCMTRHGYRLPLRLHCNRMAVARLSSTCSHACAWLLPHICGVRCANSQCALEGSELMCPQQQRSRTVLMPGGDCDAAPRIGAHDAGMSSQCDICVLCMRDNILSRGGGLERRFDVILSRTNARGNKSKVYASLNNNSLSCSSSASAEACPCSEFLCLPHPQISLQAAATRRGAAAAEAISSSRHPLAA
jgi:hypothetical protein